MNPTQRLTFAPITEDWTEVIFAENLGNVKEYFYDFKTIEECRAWVDGAVRAQAETGKKEFVILANGEFVGMISPSINDDHTGDIGMWIATSKQGRGYGREALTAAINYLRDQGVDRVVYEIEDGNVASERLVMSLGAT